MESTPGTDVQSQVERLLRDAHLARMRQQWSISETLCRKALELAPADAMGLEMLGDLLHDKGSVEEALALYRKALEQQPAKASLEEKIARAVLQKDQDERDRVAAQLFLDSPGNVKERKRNATMALLLSLVCPGAGQIFNGQYVKGGILLVVGLISLFFGAPDMMKMFVVFAAGRSPAPPNGMLASLGVLGFLVWLYSLLDAASQAGKKPKNNRADASGL